MNVRPTWEQRFEKCLNSADWADCFPLCAHHTDPDHDILTSWDMMNLNCLVLGRIGKGKTWRVLSKAILAGIAAADKSIAVIDHKGDPTFENFIRFEAERAGLPFKVVSTRRGHASNVCNLLYEITQIGMSPDEVAYAVGLAMATVFLTRVYGAAFFSDQAVELGMQYFRKSVFDDAPSLRHLAYRFMTPETLFPRPDLRAIIQLRSICTQASFLSNLNALPEALVRGETFRGEPVSETAWAHRFSIEDFVDGPPQVVYFDLPIQTNPGPSVITAQLFTTLLNHIIADRPVTATKLRYLLVVDEAQHWLTSKAISDMDMMRSRKVGIIAAHQNLAQLVFGTTDLRERVLSACNTHINLSASTPQEVKDIGFFGGEVDEPKSTLSLKFDETDIYRGMSFSTSTAREDRFTRNIALDIASQQELGFIRASVDVPPYRGSGLLKGGYFDFPITAERFKYLSSLRPTPATDARPAVTSRDWLGEHIDRSSDGGKRNARIFDDQDDFYDRMRDM